MRVFARAADAAVAPAAIRPYLRQPLVTAGSAYEVYSLAAFEGLIFIQIINDLGYPVFLPASLFDVASSAIPPDWICSTFQHDPILLLGPSFIASSQEAYAAMVELKPEQVDKFWRRVKALAAR